MPEIFYQAHADPTWPSSTTGDADITKWHYQESTGLLTSKEYADQKSVTYTYGAGGRLETRTWARDDGGSPLSTTYYYDPATGELTDIDYSDATPDIIFTYDRLGRQKTVSDAIGTHSFSYNNSLQLESETITGLYNKVITRTYDTADVIGRTTGFNIGTDYSVTYGYEADTGRFNAVSWNIGAVSQTANYAYVPNSDLLAQMTTDNGQITTYAYEPNRNLKTQVKNEFNSNVISQYDYQYDDMGRRTDMDASGSAPWGSTAMEQKSTSYATNMLNQYTQITTTGTQTHTAQPEYDDDGNLTSITGGDSDFKYTYNAENRLIAAEPHSPTNGDKKAEFLYDYMGRRTRKGVYHYSTGTWVQDSVSLFIYDGWNLICQTTNGGQQTTEKYFVWGLDLSQSIQGAGGVGGLIASIDISTSEMYYYHYDANGNVMQLVNASDGAIAAHYQYDAFGNIVYSTGSLAGENPFRFSTKYTDTETGLVYYGYRYYSPDLGRWINRDPIGEQGGLNLYAFIGNNALNGNDYLGLLSPFIVQLVKECAKSIVGDYLMKSFKDLYNTAMSCRDITADIKYGLPTDCNVSHETPRKAAPVDADEEVWKSIATCLWSSSKNGILEKVIDSEAERKLIEKLLDESKDAINDVIRDASVDTKYRIVYRCTSKTCVSFDVFSNTTIYIANDSITFEQKHVSLSNSCPASKRANDPIFGLCCNCKY
ncbi:MAG: RHS repeat domain-containing protein [Candidatus Hodarchaeota archaeon]